MIALLLFIVFIVVIIAIGCLIGSNEEAQEVPDKELGYTLYLFAVKKSGSNAIYDAGKPKFFAEYVVVENGTLKAITQNKIYHEFAPGTWESYSRIGGPFTTEKQLIFASKTLLKN